MCAKIGGAGGGSLAKMAESMADYAAEPKNPSALLVYISENPPNHSKGTLKGAVLLWLSGSSMAL